MGETYYIDIDGTICTLDENGNYNNAIPYHDRIKKINDLYDKGNTVIYWTARGTKTGIDWSEMTKNQLIKWGVKYNNILMNKPFYDKFIDDKAFNSESFFI